MKLLPFAGMISVRNRRHSDLVQSAVNLHHDRVPVSRRVDVEGLTFLALRVTEEGKQPFDIDPPGDRDTDATDGSM
jgi:hypothetical protein